jgi:hypothetical protein
MCSIQDIVREINTHTKKRGCEGIQEAQYIVGLEGKAFFKIPCHMWPWI